MGGRCFVIIPYETRDIEFYDRDSENSNDIITRPLNFSEVYEKIIQPAIREAGFEPVLSDNQPQILITKRMFEDLRSCDAAVADITMANPNVFYELGVRHALRRNRTVLVRHKFAVPWGNEGGAPFDIVHLRRIHYTLNEDMACECRQALTEMLLQRPGPNEFDSPVFEALPFLNVADPGRSLQGDRRRPKFALKTGDGRSIGIVPGELEDVSFIDVWVNSENTQFEMARFGESAISSTIRYLGSTKSETRRGIFFRDEVNLDLQREKRRIDHGYTHVTQGQVILTPPRGLASPRYNVRCIAHVAAVKSESGSGFAPVDNLGACVRNVIQTIARRNGRTLFKDARLRSVLFPLLATGQALQSPEVVVPPLVNAAIESLEQLGDNSLKEIYFLARTDLHFELLERQLKERSDRLKMS